jgi:hypothetical protein
VFFLRQKSFEQGDFYYHKIITKSFIIAKNINMTIFKTFMGIALLTTSLTGEATGKIGRYGSTAVQYVSCAGKETTGFIGDVSYKASERINN